MCIRDRLQDERVDPSDFNNYAIKQASEKGHLEVVQLLLQDERVDPSVDDNWAIRWASKNGHSEVVEALEHYRPQFKKQIVTAIACMKRCRIYKDVRNLIIDEMKTCSPT